MSKPNHQERKRRLAMLAENLEGNERALREGKITAETHAIRKRDAVNRMAEIRRGKY